MVGFPTSATMYSVDGPKPAGRDFTLWTDPNLAANETAAKLTTALMQLPTLMITSDMKNVFGSNGIQQVYMILFNLLFRCYFIRSIHSFVWIS